ncbi:hypothetical protein BC936DRAFT_138733 [Jimgerdemannia flammicorona]|uniref:Signal peptidase complex catalytic subunit SEC11 n=1 Tax=Jimgerdemannia flammicorona TaxID=994334 RepID=A0A433BMG1_9FUNG|nr:hypothetical protein BC936DRAFT_138733 [Jimgerdemannia flammicorona]
MFEFVEMVFMSNFIGFRSREPTFNVSGWQAATRIKFPSFNYPNYLPAHGHPAPPTMLAAVADQVKAFRQLNKRQIANQILNFVMIIASALMIWKALSLATNSESPIVVVLSGSMEPAFYRGDLLFLNMPTSESIKVGDICVFKIPGRDVPIVHRVVEAGRDCVWDIYIWRDFLQGDIWSAQALWTVWMAINLYKTGKQFLLTKGDNNQVDDRGLYNQGQMWIHRDHVVGKGLSERDVILTFYFCWYAMIVLTPLPFYSDRFLPYIGMVTILMNDYPQLKYVLLGGLGLFVLIHRE